MRIKRTPDAKVYIAADEVNRIRQVYPRREDFVTGHTAEIILKSADYFGEHFAEMQISNRNKPMPLIANGYSFTERTTGERFDMPTLGWKEERGSESYGKVARILEKRAKKNGLKKGPVTIVLS